MTRFESVFFGTLFGVLAIGPPAILVHYFGWPMLPAIARNLPAPSALIQCGSPLLLAAASLTVARRRRVPPRALIALAICASLLVAIAVLLVPVASGAQVVAVHPAILLLVIATRGREWSRSGGAV